MINNDFILRYKEKVNNIDVSKVNKEMIEHLLTIENIILNNQYYERCWAVREEYERFLDFKNKESD